MALVNKFNVNKKEVTLDADIIENMTANDVSYNSSLQYDENTVGEKLSELEYDVTENNDGITFTSLSELLSSKNLSTLIPTSVRHGGMNIRFIQSSDNKYVQYRLISPSWSTVETDWQGVDEEPIEKSNNLIKSGAVKEQERFSEPLYVNKYVNKYIDSEGVIRNDTNFDTFEYDILESTLIHLFVATGGGYIIVKDAEDNILISRQSSTNNNKKYVSLWLTLDLTNLNAAKLFVTQYKKFDVHTSVRDAYPLKVLMNNRWSGESVEYTQNEIDKLMNNLELVNSTSQADIRTKMNLSLKRNVGTDEVPVYEDISNIDIPQATEEKAGLLNSEDKGFVNYLKNGSRDEYTYGLIETTKHFITKGQIFATNYPVTITGRIISLNLNANIEVEDETIVIGIANYNSDNDTLVIESSYDINVSNGDNILDTPIPIIKGQYVCYLQKASSTLDKFLHWDYNDLSDCSFSTHNVYNCNTISVGTVLTRNDMNIHFNPSLTIEYNKTIIDDIEEAKETLKNTEDRLTNIETTLETELDLTNKNVVFIGDSITDSHGDGGWYAKKFIQKTNCNGYNRGWSGSTVATGYNSMCDRLDLEANDSQDLSANYLGFPSSADIIFFYGGINDWGRLRDQVFGDLLSPPTKDTFCGALKYMMMGLKTRYSQSQIVIINLHHTYSTTSFTNFKELSYEDNDERKQITIAQNNVGKTLQDYRQAIENCANMYGLPIIDMYNVGFSAIVESDQIYYKDGLHLSELGGDIMANYIISQLKSIMSKK